MKTVYDHLVDRHMSFNNHRVWIDECSRVATFPLLNLSYQMVGYQQYRPDSDKTMKNNPKDGRYFTYCKKESRGVWGLESWNFSNTLFVTEGIFDACRITELGYSAIATLSNDPKHLANWLYVVGQDRPVICVCDEGKAGSKLKKYGHASITVEDGDLGDASENYVIDLVKNYG